MSKTPNTPPLNLFATVLTQAAPSSNYRGESAENRTVLQKISKSGADHTVVSPESIRNALREIIAARGLPVNRTRLHDADQLAVEFKDYPDAHKYADDFLFGYMVADGKKMPKGRPAKRDSVLRMNLAVALSPYRFDATFHQSPQNAGNSPWKNTDNSQLLHREVAYTSYQFPFALAGADCAGSADGPGWAKALLRAVGELANVAGGHARSFFEMSPRSIVARLTPCLVAGFDTYGFDPAGGFRDLSRLRADDLPAKEFWIGGEIAREMPEADRTQLAAAGAHLYPNPQRMLEELGAAAYGTP